MYAPMKANEDNFHPLLFCLYEAKYSMFPIFLHLNKTETESFLQNLNWSYNLNYKMYTYLRVTFNMKKH